MHSINKKLRKIFSQSPKRNDVSNKDLFEVASSSANFLNENSLDQLGISHKKPSGAQFSKLVKIKNKMKQPGVLSSLNIKSGKGPKLLGKNFVETSMGKLTR